MGYKLAGFDVLGGVEIDEDMMKLYRANHSPDPSFSFLMPIQDFPAMDRTALPPELFDLDVLDGSPPCSSFSEAGAREKYWGEKKAFREGQTEQVLDDLFFHFIKVADILRPKIVVSENVRGLLKGNARGYVKQIFEGFTHAGYETQLFLLNAASMGVPQARERTFFISRRMDLHLPKVVFDFQEPPITCAEAFADLDPIGDPIENQDTLRLWLKCLPGERFANHGGYNMQKKLNPRRPANTQATSCRHLHWSKPNFISDAACVRLQSFPADYYFCGQDVTYVCGMSVPPFMMQRVASAVRDQLLSGLAR